MVLPPNAESPRFSATTLAFEGGLFGLFALIAIGLTSLWWRGQVPFPFLGTDLANISSYAAALMEPGRFAGDIAIGDPQNFRFYMALHVPLLMWLEPLLGDFGSAALVLLAVVIFLQTAGYYVLGRAIFARRLPAICLALVALGKVDFTVDYFGTYTDAEPRFLFQSLLPWLLAAVLWWSVRVRTWPWIMAVAGLLIYVHPVSAPSVGFATWLGLWAYRPQAMSIRTITFRMGIAGASFLAVCTPFLWVYLTSREYGISDDYVMMFEAQRRLIGPIFFDVRLYVGEMLKSWTVWLLVTWGLSGAIVAYRLQRAVSEMFVFWTLWAIGIALSSVGIAAVEQRASQAYGVLPAGIDLVRNARYLALVLVVFGVWGSWCLAQRMAENRARCAMTAVALAFLAVNRPGMIPVRHTLQCWAEGRLLCPRAEWANEIATLSFLRNELPPRTRVLTALQLYVDLGFEMAIRYHARQPIVFNPKDAGSTLSYGNWDALRQWLAIEQHPARWPPDASSRLAYAMELAHATAADVVVTDLPPNPEVLDARLLFSKGRFYVYARGEPPSPPRVLRR